MMRWLRGIALVALAAAAFGAGRISSIMVKRRIHVLETPLMLEGEGEDRPYCLLPAGTTLYYDHSLPEGVSRYLVYLNYEGPPLTVADEPRPNWVAPLTARAPEKEDVVRLVSEYPLEKEDLRRILDAVPLSKADLQALVDAYDEP